MRISGFPILLILRFPLTLVPEVFSVGAKPKYDANCLEDLKLSNPLVAMIKAVAVRSPTPLIDFKLVTTYGYKLLAMH